MRLSLAKIMIPKLIQLKTQFKIGMFEIDIFISSVSPKSLSHLVGTVIFIDFIDPLLYETILFEVVKDISMSKT